MDSLDNFSLGRPDQKRLRKKAKKAFHACGKQEKSEDTVTKGIVPFIDVHAHLMGGNYSGAAKKHFI